MADQPFFIIFDISAAVVLVWWIWKLLAPTHHAQLVRRLRRRDSDRNPRSLRRLRLALRGSTRMIVYADTSARDALSVRPQLNREATFKFATALFPKEELAPLDDGNLAYTCPPNDELHVGCFPGVSVVAAKEFGIDRPSRLPNRFIEAGGSGTVTVHAMHSVVDWFAYAQWANGKLIRSLSLSPDSGILEDIGQRLSFEEPYWSGEHPVVEDEEADVYPFPFHPLELGDAALAALFGYQLEGVIDPALLEPETIPLARYKRSRAFWKFWR